MKKKLTTLILSILMVFTIAFAATACKDPVDPPTESTLKKMQEIYNNAGAAFKQDLTITTLSAFTTLDEEQEEPIEEKTLDDFLEPFGDLWDKESYIQTYELAYELYTNVFNQSYEAVGEELINYVWELDEILDYTTRWDYFKFSDDIYLDVKGIYENKAVMSITATLDVSMLPGVGYDEGYGPLESTMTALVTAYYNSETDYGIEMFTHFHEIEVLEYIKYDKQDESTSSLSKHKVFKPGALHPIMYNFQKDDSFAYSGHQSDVSLFINLMETELNRIETELYKPETNEGLYVTAFTTQKEIKSTYIDKDGNEQRIVIRKLDNKELYPK